MQRRLLPIAIVAIFAIGHARSAAQVVSETVPGTTTSGMVVTSGIDIPTAPYGGTQMYSGSYSVFGAPGYYGVAYGTASFGVPRTYTAFASSFGAGYGYGYAPYAYMPGRFGVGLWQPGRSGPSAVGGYRTFPVPANPDVVPPPLGLYAPGYGPPAVEGW